MQNGGRRPGAGRPPLTETQKTFIAQVEELLPQAIAHLRESLESHNISQRNWATEIVLKKTVPDKKAIEVSGKDGKDLQIIVKVVEEKETKENGS